MCDIRQIINKNLRLSNLQSVSSTKNDIALSQTERIWYILSRSSEKLFNLKLLSSQLFNFWFWKINAPVAQLDRVLASGAKGRAFKSRRARLIWSVLYRNPYEILFIPLINKEGEALRALCPFHGIEWGLHWTLKTPGGMRSLLLNIYSSHLWADNTKTGEVLLSPVG